MERLSPKVTGLSPMTGLPGTKITIRGDNFGENSEDIIGLTINGADCWPYLEWKSPKKIVCRCCRVIGSGDIIITTKSGGLGTCEVQFNCYEESVSSTQESAVWVDDFKSSTNDQENLGSNANPNRDHSTDICSIRFNPQYFLAMNYTNADMGKLRQLSSELKSKLSSTNTDEETSHTNRNSLLKSNLSTIMDCLDILEDLSKNVSKSDCNLEDKIIDSIQKSVDQTHKIFDPLLDRKDVAIKIESLRPISNTLSKLKSAIDTSKRNKNYDSVIEEISSVLCTVKTIEMDKCLWEKIQVDVLALKQDLVATIKNQLHQICTCNASGRGIDDVKKLLNNLNRLENNQNYDIWDAVSEMKHSLMSTLDDKYRYFLDLSKSNPRPDLPRITFGHFPTNHLDDQPYVVQFVHSAIKIFNETYYNIVELGRSYFDPKDEFSCKEPSDIKYQRLNDFENNFITEPVIHMRRLLSSSLMPDQSDTQEWPSNETNSYVAWLKDVLQSVIECHVYLINANLPSSARAALELFKEMVFELRVSSMKILFRNAKKFNESIHEQEDWITDVDDTFGGRTKSPHTFEGVITETLKYANDTIFKTCLPDEQSILKKLSVQAEMKISAQKLINSFISSLEQGLENSRDQPDIAKKILITVCNCQYTRDHIFSKLQDEFEKLDTVKMDGVFKVCKQRYSEYISTKCDEFCTFKYKQLIRLWKAEKKTSLDSLHLSLLMVNADTYLIAPHLVNYLMTSIVNKVHGDVSRLN